jgi:hypothetical protein
VQLQQRYENQRQQRASERMALLAQARRLASLQQRLELHDALLLGLSQGNVPRLQQLVLVALRNREGIGSIVSKVHAALRGMYQPKGWQLDDKAFDLGYLALHLGGPQLLTALNREGMLPSVSWVQAHSKQLPRLLSPLAAAAFPTDDRGDAAMEAALRRVLLTNITAVVVKVGCVRKPKLGCINILCMVLHCLLVGAAE